MVFDCVKRLLRRALPQGPGLLAMTGRKTRVSSVRLALIGRKTRVSSVRLALIGRKTRVSSVRLALIGRKTHLGERDYALLLVIYFLLLHLF